MNNNDLIDRVLVLEFLDDFCAGYPARLIEEVGEDMQAEFTASEIAEIVVANTRALRFGISLFPAVEHTMSAVEYARIDKIFRRWCLMRSCSECDFYGDCINRLDATPEERVAAIRKWTKEHLEEVEE